MNKFKKPLDLALKYMDIFYNSGRIDELCSILAADGIFEGPLNTFISAADYITVLPLDPPRKLA